MSSFISFLLDHIYGKAYTNKVGGDIEEGGAICFGQNSVERRLVMHALSAIINLYIVYFTYKSIKQKSKECELSLVKNKKPTTIEKVFGIVCLFVLIAQFFYKSYSKKAIFLLNLCHSTLMLEVYLLLSSKTVRNGLIYICFMVWVPGSFMATLYPNTTGLDLPYEVQLFFLEHVVLCLGPFVLILSGRYGFYREGVGMALKKQFFGMGWAVLIQRFILAPITLLTQVNLNYILCPNRADFFAKLFGEYYLFMGDYYVGLTSAIFQLILVLLIGLIQYLYTKICRSRNETQQEYLKNKKKK